jgi:DNA primase
LYNKKHLKSTGFYKMFTSSSLEQLKQRVKLLEVITPYVELKRSGAAYKGLCPFHDEKSPSFVIQNGDSHYHCFGCGAHGDSIGFLMNHQKLSFVDAIELLADKFHVRLERTEKSDPASPNKAGLKHALEIACKYYQSMLFHTDEGHNALDYLATRAIDQNFVRQFSLGFAPEDLAPLLAVMRANNINNQLLIEAGIITESSQGRLRHCYGDRITFPIRDAQGAVIGFSGRKFKEDTYGGKYVNTAETPLFKKSRTLFGLSYARRSIAKGRRAIIVEGQIDTLRLIYNGWPMTVAGQGTAFGEEHAKQLIALGVQEVFLAFDGDTAGIDASIKVGDIFQREGVAVSIVALPANSDPDSFIKEKGAAAFEALLKSSNGYIEHLIEYHKRQIPFQTPAGKNALVTLLAQQIRSWSQPLMVHESLKQIAKILAVPDNILGVGADYIPNIHLQTSASAGIHQVDPDRILEIDLLRWLILVGSEQPKLQKLATTYLSQEALTVSACRNVYACYLARFAQGQGYDLLSLTIALPGEQEQQVIAEIPTKKINREKAEVIFLETIQKLLDRNWMRQREAIRMKMQSGQCSEEQIMLLAQQFDSLKRTTAQR